VSREDVIMFVPKDAKSKIVGVGHIDTIVEAEESVLGSGPARVRIRIGMF
jgi:hypothetical protein